MSATGDRRNLRLALQWVTTLGIMVLAVQVVVWMLRPLEYLTCTPALDPSEIRVFMPLAVGFALLWAAPPVTWSVYALRLARRSLPDIDSGRARGIVLAVFVIAVHWVAFGTAMTWQAVQAGLPEDFCAESAQLRAASVWAVLLFFPMVGAALYAAVVGKDIRRSTRS